MEGSGTGDVDVTLKEAVKTSPPDASATECQMLIVIAATILENSAG